VTYIIVDRGGPRDKQSIQLATRLGNWIRNEQRHERSPASLRAAEEIWRKALPSAELRSSTATYNCVGMVFACRRTWVAPEELELILGDDGHRRVVDRNAVKAGDVVVYKDSDNKPLHIAVVLEARADVRMASTELTVLSKWGADGEYLHRELDVPPDYGTTTEYWTERKEIP